MGKSKDERIIANARMRIDADTDKLENFDPNQGDSYESFEYLIRDLRSESQMRYATLAQAERLRQLFPEFVMIVREIMLERPGAELDEFGGEVDRLFDRILPGFITDVLKLVRTRRRQSASGRGAFGRPTIAGLRERNAQLAAELAELRQASDQPPPAELEDQPEVETA